MDEPWPTEPFTRADLDRLGHSESTLRRGLRAGLLRTVVRGVFVRSDVPDDHDLRVRAVALVVRSHHVVVDRTAAWLHGIDAHVYSEHDGVLPVEICALRGHQPTCRLGADGRSRDLLPEDVMVLHGVRVTTPLRTALDLGCCLRRREAFAALNAFAHDHRLCPHDYIRTLARYRRRRGVVQLRSLAALIDPRVESPRESWVLLAIIDAELPRPEPQAWIDVDGVPTYRLDFAYRRRRVCVEYDGHEAHDGRAQEIHDDERRDWLRRHGWTVVVVREGDFTGEALDRWIRELRDALVSAYSNRRW